MKKEREENLYFGDRDIKAILEESKKCDLIIFMKSMNEATEAAAEFVRRAITDVEFVGNWTTCRSEKKNFIEFKSVDSICRNRMDGYRGKVVFHIPELEIISKIYGGVCTLEQLAKISEEENK